jgi:hypothetical protein
LLNRLGFRLDDDWRSLGKDFVVAAVYKDLVIGVDVSSFLVSEKHVSTNVRDGCYPAALRYQA